MIKVDVHLESADDSLYYPSSRCTELYFYFLLSSNMAPVRYPPIVAAWSGSNVSSVNLKRRLLTGNGHNN